MAWAISSPPAAATTSLRTPIRSATTAASAARVRSETPAASSTAAMSSMAPATANSPMAEAISPAPSSRASPPLALDVVSRLADRGCRFLSLVGVFVDDVRAMEQLLSTQLAKGHAGRGCLDQGSQGHQVGRETVVVGSV